MQRSRATERKEIGFWRDGITPHLFVDEKWSSGEDCRVVTRYLQAGYLDSFEFGYSYCRFAGCPGAVFGGTREMGCTALTDGVYVWPEGLLHYVTQHNVRPPEAFIKHAKENLQYLLATQADGRLQWEDELKAPVGIPRGTQEFLRDKSSLEEIYGVEDDRKGFGLWITGCWTCRCTRVMTCSRESFVTLTE